MAEDTVKILVPSGRPIGSFLTLCADTQFQGEGEPRQQGRKIHGGGKMGDFETEIAVYLGNGAS